MSSNKTENFEQDTSRMIENYNSARLTLTRPTIDWNYRTAPVLDESVDERSINDEFH
jgi:hypothetical protein